MAGNGIGLLYFCLCSFLIIAFNCKLIFANVPGVMTVTRVSKFRFFQRIVNPCGISPAATAVLLQPGNSTNFLLESNEMDNNSSSSSESTTMSFFALVETGLERMQRKLAAIEAEDQALTSGCFGKLRSLPATLHMDNLNRAETLKQAYKSVIFLATHFHLVSFDRQLDANGDDQLAEDQLQEEWEVPSWRFRNCSGEPSSLQTNLEELATEAEGLICTILTEATEKETSSFRTPMKLLETKPLLRYHSCSNIRQRDCLVFSEAKRAVNLLLNKFQSLAMGTSEAL